MNVFEALGLDEGKPAEKKWKKVSGFIKIGRVFSFKALSQSRNACGDWECVKFLQLMSSREPDTKFMIISGSDLDKISPAERKRLFPNENVFASANNHHIEPAYLRKTADTNTHDVQEVYIIGGPTGTRNGNIPFMKEDGSPFKFICMNENYVAPSIHWLNTFKVPSMLLVTDTRYFPHGFDWIESPKTIVCQLTREDRHYQGKHKHIDSLDDPNANSKLMTEYPFHTNAARLETLWLYGRPEPKWLKDDSIKLTERSDKLLVVANQVSGVMNKRYELIKQYVTSQGLDAVLVGKWQNEEAIEMFKDILYDKDGVDGDTLENVILPSYRFGVIFNYDGCSSGVNHEEDDNWVVCKLWEYLYNGIVPILIGFKGAYGPVPPQLMCNSPEEFAKLYERLKGLNEHQVRNLIKIMLREEYYTGDYLYDRIYDLKKQDSWPVHLTEK